MIFTIHNIENSCRCHAAEDISQQINHDVFPVSEDTVLVQIKSYEYKTIVQQYELPTTFTVDSFQFTWWYLPCLKWSQ